MQKYSQQRSLTVVILQQATRENIVSSTPKQ